MSRGRPKNPPPLTPRQCVGEYANLLRDGLRPIEAQREIQKKYGHNPETMRTAYRRHDGEEETYRHGNCALSDEDEEAIEGLIIAFDFYGQTLPPDTIRKTASAVLGVTITSSWWTTFLGRHDTNLAKRRKALRPVNPTLLDLPDEIRHWCDILERYHEK